MQPQLLPDPAQESYQGSPVARKTLSIGLHSCFELERLPQTPDPRVFSRQPLTGWLQLQHRHRSACLRLGPSRSLGVVTIRHLYCALSHALSAPFSSFLTFSFNQHLFEPESAIINFQLAFPRFTGYLVAIPFVLHLRHYY